VQAVHGRSPDRFTTIGWKGKAQRNAVLDDVIAWIGCDIDRVRKQVTTGGSSAESSNLKRSATVRRWSLCVAVLDMRARDADGKASGVLG